MVISCSEQESRRHPGLGEYLPPGGDLNFLVVSFDALRADALGLYGYPRNTSPNLDAFAERALVFETAYTASPTTPTSFAAAFTGQYPYRVFLGWKLIPTTTLADLMQQAGYHTFALLHNVQLVSERNFDQGFDRFEAGSWPDEKVLEMATQWLEEARDRPFFGWIHFISPHTPYDYREISAHLAEARDEGRFATTTPGEFEVETEEELVRVRDLYDGEVYFADYLFGQLMQHLDALGLSSNTVVIVTSDHGEEFMDHGQLQHNALYEELIRVPLLIRHPAMESGARTHAPFVNVDLLPTVAAMAGLEPPGHIDGINLLEPFDAGRYRLSAGMTNAKRQEMAAVQNSMKLILSCSDYREELYNLSQDPGEENDLILDQPTEAGRLYDAMVGITVADPCKLLKNANRGRAPEDLLTPEQIEELRSLGYIQ